MGPPVRRRGGLRARRRGPRGDRRAAGTERGRRGGGRGDGLRRPDGATLDTDGLKELLYASAESPAVGSDVASRCLACTNCTMVCPTCFCTTVEDVADLTGDDAERHRVWDSCFDAEFSYIHGGIVRESTKSRYRQWMTHKLGGLDDQFGTSGCVGCGRCVTWCPAAIDITAEAADLRGLPGSNLPGNAPAPPSPEAIKEPSCRASRSTFRAPVLPRARRLGGRPGRRLWAQHALPPGSAPLPRGRARRTLLRVRHGRVAIEVRHLPGRRWSSDTVQAGDVVGWSWLVPPYRWTFDGRATEEPVRSRSRGLPAGQGRWDPATGTT